jgi:DNA-entry nuclease
MPSFSASDVPGYTDQPYVAVNGNIPFFTPNQYVTESYEYYSPLDSLGRCGTAVASIGRDIMPTEDRESISSVKPTGWHSVAYPDVGVSSLYNRSHLIAFQLTGENANRENLISGTQYMNQTVMTRFENMVAAYITETGNHVLYRVTPIFTGNNLVADGVLMEAWSVEDGGEGICYCVYLYNVQPGVEINYATGESEIAEGDDGTESVAMDYIINKRNGKFHHVYCSGVASMSESNKLPVFATREELVEQGYTPCGSCNP